MARPEGRRTGMTGGVYGWFRLLCVELGLLRVLKEVGWTYAGGMDASPVKLMSLQRAGLHPCVSAQPCQQPYARSARNPEQVHDNPPFATE
jgi:hypothetical protein